MADNAEVTGGGYMVAAGRADVFYGLLPHGLLELTIIFVASGAGLRLGWSWIATGRRTRSQALAAAPVPTEAA